MDDSLGYFLTVLGGVFGAVALDWAAFEKLAPELRIHSSPTRETGYFDGSKVRFVGVGFIGAYAAVCVANDLHSLLGATIFAFFGMVGLRFYEIYPEQRAFWFGLLTLGLVILGAILTGIVAT